jgi:hypothetical protein
MLEACKDGRKQTTVNKEPQTRASRSTHAGAFSLVSRSRCVHCAVENNIISAHAFKMLDERVDSNAE